MKRSHASRGVSQNDPSAQKVDRQELYDELKKRAPANESFAPVDVALAIGAAEAAVSKALLALATERIVEKVDGGRFRAGPIAEVELAPFARVLSAASSRDPRRQQETVEIQRLKANNDIMRDRLVKAQQERDRYLALLQKHGIDPNQAP